MIRSFVQDSRHVSCDVQGRGSLAPVSIVNHPVSTSLPTMASTLTAPDNIVFVADAMSDNSGIVPDSNSGTVRDNSGTQRASHSSASVFGRDGNHSALAEQSALTLSYRDAYLRKQNLKNWEQFGEQSNLVYPLISRDYRLWDVSGVLQDPLGVLNLLDAAWIWHYYRKWKAPSNPTEVKPQGLLDHISHP
jgi:hypothetical protein